MHKYLDKQIGVNVEAYVDDVLVKTKRANTLNANWPRPSPIYVDSG